MRCYRDLSDEVLTFPSLPPLVSFVLDQIYLGRAATQLLEEYSDENRVCGHL